MDVGDVASWAMAEAIYRGADPHKYLGRPYEESTPEAVIMACVDALDEVTDLECYVEMTRAIMGVRKMTRERFVEICVEEGLTEAEAQRIWTSSMGAGLDPEELDEDGVRAAAQHTLPIARLMREGADGNPPEYEDEEEDDRC